MIVSCEMARMGMKVHAYFREKMLLAVYPENSYAKFIPNWAEKLGTKESDLDIP
jgi:hypothetical protein